MHAREARSSDTIAAPTIGSAQTEPSTDVVARTMTRFNRDESWHSRRHNTDVKHALAQHVRAVIASARAVPHAGDLHRAVAN
jgi:hypothetical protein